METAAVIAFFAVVALYTRRALRRVLPSNRPPAMRDCMFVPDALTAAAMVISGVLFGLKEGLGLPDGWHEWSPWLFHFMTPIWVGWCIGVVVTCLVAQRRIRRRLGRQGQHAPL